MGRLKLIDGLRGVAAMMVVLYHLMGRTSAARFSSWGYLGVGIFFVLSGFVIASVVGDQKISASYLGRFAARRAVRLDIPYWLNIGLVIVVGVMIGRHYSTTQVMSHLFYLQELAGFTELNPAYWTLCFEIQFYLALILLIWACQRTRQTVFSWVLLLTVFLSALTNAGLLGIPRGTMFAYWWAFGLGTITYWTIEGNLRLRYLMATAALIILIPRASHVEWRVVALLTAALLVAASRLNAMGRWLADPVAQFMGRISYSLYLIHPLVGWILQSFVARHANQYIALLAGISASILSAWACYLWIERPATRLSHRITLSPTVRSRPAASPRDRSLTVS